MDVVASLGGANFPRSMAVLVEAQGELLDNIEAQFLHMYVLFIM
jgi:hypothetical protein